MDRIVNGYGAKKANSKLLPQSYEIKKIAPKEVVVEISHCGICYSDIHLIDNDWGISNYPFIPGHEIVGCVTQKGSQVKNLKIGQRVGIGWFSKVCEKCTYCKTDRDNMCASPEMTAVGRNGGFADYVKADKSVVYPIPEKLKSEHAAPLMCAGWTVHGAYRGYKVKPKDRVAVIGIGGLGHLAIQYGKAMGYHVTAVTSSSSKKTEAKKFGANVVVDYKNLSKLKNKFDFILVTAHADLDWTSLTNTLDVDGNICFVGIPPSPISIHAFSLIMKRIKISGNPGGSRKMMKEMLKIAAEKNIKPIVEQFKFSDVNKAIKKVKENKIRYRAVLSRSI
tara:strand:- start:1134 stop:2141 length:1008 start_codon:yes stop_codon:yes gene_type:complete